MSSELRVNVLRGSTANGNITIQCEGTSNLGGATMQLQQGLTKAWFYTTDKTTHVIDNSLNISTITDNNAGRPEANFTNNFNNTSIVAPGDAGYNRFVGSYTVDGGITTSSFAHAILSGSESISDVAASGVGLGIQYNGDLA